MEKRTILVVEDNASNMKLVRSLLQIGGYKIIEAQTAEAGLELAREHAPDLILMDIQLPGMDGLSATRQIQTEPKIKEIPVLALTAYAMKGDEQKVLDAGCVGYVSKPINTRAFLSTLLTYLPTDPGKRNPAPPDLQTEPVSMDIHPDIFYASRILIVDDDPLNVKLLKAKLSEKTFVTSEAFNGLECLDKAKSEHPDLILLDLMMPGLDGFEVTRRLKKDPQTREIPIIHVTALDSSENKARAMDAGADEFLNKPINTVELLTRIRSLLRLNKYKEQLGTRKESEIHFLPSGTFDSEFEEIDLRATVLIADTNKKDVEFFKKNLGPYCRRPLITGSGKEAVQIAESQQIDIVLLAISLSDMDGHEVCRRLKAMDRTRNIQVITTTSLADLDTKIKSIELGTDDYLIKPINELEFDARIRSLIKKKAYLDILVSKYESAFNAAVTDQLTALYNHAFFEHYLGLELNRSLRQKHFVTLLMLDIDDFKNLNDCYGHQEGDRILHEVAAVIRNCVRAVDVCARYGGEEFAVVLPYANRRIGGMIAERICKSISAIQVKSDNNSKIGRITVSIGVAICPQDAVDVEALVHKADMAMYQAKKEGKNRVSYCNEN
ncbi:response regulator [Desulfoluna sp.]|uniref:response regulator n=1 Tax=Desulfoluna sp. TaxID=2045199 RepID=UPI002637A78B|nr:response regulator [Desulfoluna sp.]